ncbi:MAG: DEAD/DEAH box helicase [Myxococcota bacterium]|nr:DEAD/DEAH box helicase [Myxococcota bacterium]
MPVSTFSELALIPPLQRAIAEAGYETPTPIQAQAIPPILDGHDVLGCAQTGTGKTAAFALPVLQHIERSPRGRGRRHIQALVLTPTRELASQIAESFSTYGRHLDLRCRVIFGGVSQRPQVAFLRDGIDVLVATPGRLLDLHGQGHIDLSHVDFFVLDEADRMLDMGFIHDIRRVLAVLPDRRQNLLFSATMPPDIVNLAGGFLRDPIRVEVAPESTTVERIDQYIMYVQKSEKRRLLTALLENPRQGIEQAIVFTRTKHGANRVVQHLQKAGQEAAAIHGNKSQGARERALGGFHAGTLRVLVATDVAARGIDVDGVTHVFNFDLPYEPESYVHRIGRTGRAGREGTAIAFCQEDDGPLLHAIERLTGIPLTPVVEQPYHDPACIPGPDTRGGKGRRGPSGPRPGGGGRRGGGGGRRGGGRRGSGGGGSRRGGRGGGRGGRR